MVAEAGCRTRKDSVMMVETLITASPEFMHQLPPEEQKAYFQTAPVSYTHLLYTSGAIAELGSVDEGTTRTYTMNLERQGESLSRQQ